MGWGWGIGMGGRDDRAAAYRLCCTALLLCCSAALLPVVGRGQRVGSSAGARQGCPTPCGASHWHPTAAQHRSFQVPSSVVRFLLGSCLPKNPRIPYLPGLHLKPGLPGLPASLLASSLIRARSPRRVGDIRLPPETFDPTDYAAETETRRLTSRLSLSQPEHPLSLRSAKRGCLARSSLSPASGPLRQRGKGNQETKKREKREKRKKSLIHQTRFAGSLGLLGPRSPCDASFLAPRLAPLTPSKAKGRFSAPFPQRKSRREHSSAGSQHWVSLWQQSGTAVILALGPNPWPSLDPLEAW